MGKESEGMSETLHVAVAANEGYMPGAIVALAGVAVHAQSETPLHFHVFTDEDVLPETMAHLQEVLTRLHPKSVVEQHVCDEAMLAGLPAWKGSRMPWARCYSPIILKDVDWCLCLDSDVLYLASIEEHFSYRDENVYACVVQEESEKTRLLDCGWARAQCGVDIPDEEYFNAGVMLFNLRKCREDSILEKILKCVKEHPDVGYADQTAMNVVFHGKKKMIPPKFDRLQIFFSDEKLRERPVIHYVWGSPWLPTDHMVASGRFRLWHAFADKYVWQKKGESCRRLFSRRIRLMKRVMYVIVKTPGVREAFLFVSRRLGFVGATSGWLWRQVKYDCTSAGIKKALKGNGRGA